MNRQTPFLICLHCRGRACPDREFTPVPYLWSALWGGVLTPPQEPGGCRSLPGAVKTAPYKRRHICRLYHKKRLPHKVKPHAAASRQNPFPGKNIEILLDTFLIRKVSYFSMTSFVSRAIISSSLVSMISVRTRAPQAVTSTTSFFCLWASRFLSVSMRMPSQSM